MRGIVGAGIVVGVAAVVWLGVRGGDSEPASVAEHEGRLAVSTGPSTSAAAPSGGAFSRPSGSAVAPLPSPGDSLFAERPLFDEADAEERDPTWATATEASARRRVDALLGGREQPTVPQLECRETVCRLLVISDSEPALRTFVAELQSERGFVGDADMLAFENVERNVGVDGAERYAVRLMLVYRR